MEKNTFATSAYIATSPEQAFDYLCDLKNLDEWTLYSRMIEQVDADTWLGTASGYQSNLYYHIKRLDNPVCLSIEWNCGLEYQKYYQIYPVFFFPPSYIEPGSTEAGVYFHWLSFVDPAKRTSMIMEGIHTVHTSECRSLKGVLERKAGHTSAATGRYTIGTDSIYVNAPIAMGVEYLADLNNLHDWAHLLRSQEQTSANSGEFKDEYDQTVKVTFQLHKIGEFYLLEQDFFYPQDGFMQRCPTILIPAAYAFGNASVPGFIQHRITFWEAGKVPKHGKLQLEDYGAESMNIKRLLEAQAGNLESFSQGMSYVMAASKV